MLLGGKDDPRQHSALNMSDVLSLGKLSWASYWAQQLLTLRQPCGGVGTFQVWGSMRFQTFQTVHLGERKHPWRNAWRTALRHCVCLQRNMLGISSLYIGTNPFAAGLFDTFFEAESSEFACQALQRIGSMNSSRLGFPRPVDRSYGLLAQLLWMPICRCSNGKGRFVQGSSPAYFYRSRLFIPSLPMMYQWQHLEMCLTARERVDNSTEKFGRQLGG